MLNRMLLPSMFGAIDVYMGPFRLQPLNSAAQVITLTRRRHPYLARQCRGERPEPSLNRLVIAD